MNFDQTPVDVATKDLSGAALSRAVALALGIQPGVMQAPGEAPETYAHINGAWVIFAPDEDWSQCGPLIDQYQINLSSGEHGLAASGAPQVSQARLNGRSEVFEGETGTQAACRALVGALSGDIVKVPAFLVLPS